MDKISKFLKKLSSKERKRILELLLKIQNGDLYGLDVKRLHGKEMLSRVCSGSIRIIFITLPSGTTRIVDIRYCKDVYKKM